jgi:hypothetical protein
VKEIVLDDSDQGPWMYVSGLLSAEGGHIDPDGEWDDEGTASFLYDAHADVWRQYCIDGAADRHGWPGYRPRWHVDVDMVLRELGNFNAWGVEVFHYRDPDASCNVTVYLNGEQVTDLTAVSIDPGSGHSRQEWNENREHDESSDISPAFREEVMSGYDAADSSEFIRDAHQDD